MMKCAFTLFLLALSLNAALAVQRGDKITYFDQKTQRDVIGEVLSVTESGDVLASHQVFYETHSRFIKTRLGPAEFFTTVETLEGWQVGQKVCFATNTHGAGKDDDGKLTAIFENGAVEVTVGDFFGYAFLIFKRPVLTGLSNIKSCK